MSLLRININNLLTNLLLLCFAFLPLLGLLWQSEVLLIKGNWLLYPLILMAIISSVVLRNKITLPFFYFIVLAVFYSMIFFLNGGEYESILRFFFTLAPLFFFDQVRNFQSKRMVNIFLFIYSISVFVPIYFSYLQLSGKMPYHEYDVINGEYVGRISGGYSKPNNFIAILFPFFLLGMYYVTIVRRKILGIAIIVLTLAFVMITGLRIAQLIFIIITISTIQMRFTSAIVKSYYAYFLNFFVGILAIVILSIVYTEYGLVDGLRGRIPMWMAHSFEYVHHSTWVEIIFGKNKVTLPGYYDNIKLIGTLDEVHNNSFRIIITFGLVGYFIYCMVMRWIVLKIGTFQVDYKMKFIYSSCIVFLILYSITNEPAYYSSIFWSITIWLFLDPQRQRATTNSLS